MPTIKILMGLPRSGKTTFIEQRYKGIIPIISADKMRYQVYGQRFWNDGEDLMWSVRKMVLKMLLEQGINIIIDETNTTVKRRQPIIALAKEYGYTVEVYHVRTPKEECTKRAEESGDTAIIPVIERMDANLELVGLDEGVDALYSVQCALGGRRLFTVNKWNR